MLYQLSARWVGRGRAVVGKERPPSNRIVGDGRNGVVSAVHGLPLFFLSDPPILELRRKEVVCFKDCTGLAQQPSLEGVAYYRSFNFLIMGAISEFGFSPHLGLTLRLGIGGALGHDCASITISLTLVRVVHSALPLDVTVVSCDMCYRFDRANAVRAVADYNFSQLLCWFQWL